MPVMTFIEPWSSAKAPGTYRALTAKAAAQTKNLLLIVAI